MPRALLVLCCAALLQRVARRAGRRAAAGATRRTSRPSTPRSSTRSARRPRRSAPATAASSTAPTPGTRSRPRPTAWSPSPARWPAPPRHGPPRRRRAHHVLVPRPDRRRGRPARCARATSSAPPSAHLHLGARRGDAYFDPAALFDAGPPQVHLVPFDEPPGAVAPRRAQRHRPAHRRRSAASSSGAGGAAGRGGRRGSATAGRSCCGTLDHYGRRFTFPSRLRSTLRSRSWQAWQRARSAVRPPVHAPPTCAAAAADASGASPCSSPGSARTASGVAPSTRCTPTTLGYAAADVLRFSYAGGRVPDPTDGFAADPRHRPTARPTPRPTSAPPAPASPTSSSRSPPRRPACRSTCRPLPGRGRRPARPDRARAPPRRRPGCDGSAWWPPSARPTAAPTSPPPSTRGRAPSTGGEVARRARARHGQELDDDAPSVAQLGETSDLVAELADHPVPDGRGRGVDRRPRRPRRARAPQPGARAWTRSWCPLDGPTGPQRPARQRRRPPGSSRWPWPGSRPAASPSGDALLDQGVGEGISLAGGPGRRRSGSSLAARADVRGGVSGPLASPVGLATAWPASTTTP